MNSDFIAARRALFHKRIINWFVQNNMDATKYGEIFSNHPSSEEFENHFYIHTSKEKSFRIIFTGSYSGLKIYSKFVFHIAKQDRYFSLQSIPKEFLTVSEYDVKKFADEVDIFHVQIDQLYLTMKGESK